METESREPTAINHFRSNGKADMNKKERGNKLPQPPHIDAINVPDFYLRALRLDQVDPQR